MNNLIKNSFEYKQNIIILMLCVVCTKFLASCSEENNDWISPEKTIIGKWKLVELARFSCDVCDYKDREEVIKYTPTGYVEYLPDGFMIWYDYKTKKKKVLERTYWLEVFPPSEIRHHERWELNYKGLGEEIYPKDDYPDAIKLNCSNNRITFYSYNLMGIYQLCADTPIPDYYYIYKRIK